MSTTRVMSGLVDQTGREVNSLTVGEMVRRNPEPAYQMTCTICGGRQTCSQSQIRNGVARCLNSACGKVAPSTAREHATDMTARAARLQRKAEQAAVDASARRMDAETSDYKLPSKRLPANLEQTPVRERDRLSARAHRDELEAAEHAQREAREKPIRDAEAALKVNANKLAEVTRQNIATGTDDAFVLDPETLKPVPTASVTAWQRAESAKFRQANSDYFACDENLAIISAYIERNCPGIRLVSARQLTEAYLRLREYGLLKERPAPEPIAEPTPEPQPVATKPTGYAGVDPDNGEPRLYSDFEVNRMSADEFKRKIRPALQLPNVGPGPFGRRS